MQPELPQVNFSPLCATIICAKASSPSFIDLIMIPLVIIADLIPIPQWMYATLFIFLPLPYKYSPKTAVLAPLSIKQGMLSNII